MQIEKCGGITYAVKCRTCTTRKVKCSFEDEVKDPRYNPYLRLRSSPSPAVSLEQGEPDEGHFAHLASASASSINHLAPFDGGNAQALLSSVPAAPAIPSSINDGLAKEVDSLKSRIADLEKGLSTAQKSHDENIGTPRSRALTSFMLPPDVGSSHQGYQVAPEASLGSISSNGFSSPQGVVITDGPLKTVNNFQKDIPLDFQSQDPIARSIVTQGEAHVMFRLFFSSCHSNAPFLDVGMDSDVDRVRSTSVLLFLAILCVGARFWSASSKTPCWLHPRYPELIRLLDAEVMRVTLRPGPDDQKLETVQALMLCAHWIPFDLAADRKRYRSRFSEGGAWQCLGLAIRWATSLALERSCHVPFQRPETVTRTDVRRFRTMLYLIESDHYLALSARRSSHLNPEPLHAVLDTFLQGNYVQDTDIRLASLFRTAYGAHFTGCRPTTIESVEAFDKDVQLIEQHFASSPGDRSRDSLAQHFPFTSLRWYRLSYACAFLDVTDLSQRSGKALTWALEWASQILLHLSRPPSLSPPNNMNIPAQLEPDPNVVNIMSFAIDHYLVVIAYAAFFLVSSWLSNSTDCDSSLQSGTSNMQLTDIHSEPPPSRPTVRHTAWGRCIQLLAFPAGRCRRPHPRGGQSSRRPSGTPLQPSAARNDRHHSVRQYAGTTYERRAECCDDRHQ
ncbi:hypothetical protein EDD37DRAFT_216771 [Exophiala viscosa]|uniref:uncharacterized protein n=1 Tax=Exophiala viscosa TaxID=2486360 RepID=UPI00219B1EC5|nr:hypothetical protein EDD37DRAFT_216771 [Exophiala viscosa]